ncbi:hypothetical protein DH2020_018575 [Rehmannia glutinosa]|uniref:Uncharacterized protein n=1 Tax=Rehmannia glutinosa TaxID=99300 RepID=A0ABR0WLD9_REHGL
MSSDTKKPGNGTGAAAGGGGFGLNWNIICTAVKKKHVVAGIAIIGVLFGVPWYLMTSGTKHQSHQDYLEKADKARSERLSATSSTTR